MRASYVNGPELLTPLGEWVAARMPHIQQWKKKTWRGFRIFGGLPLFRRCLLDYQVRAGGYQVAFYPFKYVYWETRVTVWTPWGHQEIWRSRRLFQRRSIRPELRAPANHITTVHNKMWTEIFAGRAAIRELSKLRQEANPND